MQKQYSFGIPNTVISGEGCIEQLNSLIKAKGRSTVAVFIDSGALKSEAVKKALRNIETDLAKVITIDSVPPEPEEGQVRDVFRYVKDSGCECVVAIGGGSVMDASKMISVMLTNHGYFDDLTDTDAIKTPGVPLYAIPTTAGTGSEATPNSIVLIPDKKVKVGVVHHYFLPSTVLLDPGLTVSLPKEVTAATGLDAFCHCIETYISKKTNPFARLFALEGLRLISQSLRHAFVNGADIKAREDMLLAAFYGGVAISSSSTVAVHALSYPLGGSYRIPHGISNAILLPHIIEFNMDVILPEITPVAKAMAIDTDYLEPALVGRAVSHEIFKLVGDLGIPVSLKSFGVGPEDLDFLTSSASKIHRLLDQNPKNMSEKDIRSIYEKLL